MSRQIEGPGAYADLISKHITQLLAIQTDHPKWVEKIRRAGNSEYLHWDKFRYKRPVTDISPELGWAILKMNRMGARAVLPFKDVSGNPFTYWLPPSLQELAHRITKSASGDLVSTTPELTEEDHTRYIITNLMEEAIASSQIEGASTTRKVAKDMLRSGREPRNKSERMIVNNYLGMKMLKEMSAHPLNTEMILELHATMTAGTLDDPSSEGRFRTNDEIVVKDVEGLVVHTPTPHDKLQARMERLCDFANGKLSKDFLDPLVRASVLHYWLAYEHPFEDGNGRTARALLYWSLLRDNYWLVEFLSISRRIKRAYARYSRAFLYVATDENDLTYFLAHDFRAMAQALDEWHEYLRGRVKEMSALMDRLHALKDMNHRQRALVAHSLRNPHTIYTVRSHATSHDVTMPTARRDLKELVERAFLVVYANRKPVEYTSPPNLESKLKQRPKGAAE